MINDDDWKLNQQLKMQTEEELNEKINLGKQTNFSIGIELIPSLDDDELLRNETAYDQYVQTINNFTSLSQFNYVSNGYGPIKL